MSFYRCRRGFKRPAAFFGTTNLLEFGLWPSLPLCQQPVENWHELHTERADDDDADDDDDEDDEEEDE